MARTLPTSYDHRTFPLKFIAKEPGRCHWCGSLILNAKGLINLRKHWCNNKCVQAYLLHADHKVWRRHIYKRDMGICQGPGCGLVFDFYEDSGWEADHIIPLYAAGGDLTCWGPANGQLLCRECHKDKSRADYVKYGRPPPKTARARKHMRYCEPF